MTNQELLSFLKSKNACAESIQWIDDRDLVTAWNECPKASWLLWLYARSVNPDTIVFKTAVVELADSMLNIFEAEYPEDKRPRNAIETARRYLAGNATKEGLDAARRLAANSYVSTKDVNAGAAFVAAAVASNPDITGPATISNNSSEEQVGIVRKYLPMPALK